MHLEIAKEVDSVLCYISAAATAVSAVEVEECSLCPMFPCPELLKLTGFVIIFFRTWLIWNLFFLTVKSYQDTALAELCTNSPFFKYDACVSSLMVLMTQEQAWVKLGKRGMNFTRKQTMSLGSEVLLSFNRYLTTLKISVNLHIEIMLRFCTLVCN